MRLPVYTMDRLSRWPDLATYRGLTSQFCEVLRVRFWTRNWRVLAGYESPYRSRRVTGVTRYAGPGPAGLELTSGGPRQTVRTVGWITVGISLVLVARVLLIDNPEAIIIIVWHSSAVLRSSLGQAVELQCLVLIGATAVYLLIG